MIKRPKTPQRTALAVRRKKPSHQEDDFYANMAAMSDDDVESDISEADVNLVAKSLDDLDDMDANLFGGHKKNIEKPLTKAVTSPRRTAGTSRSLSPPTRTGITTASSSNSVPKTTKESKEKMVPAEKTKPSVDDDIDLSGLLSDDDSSFLPKETLEPTSKKFSIAAKSSTTEPSSIPKSSPSIKQATPVINAKEATTKDDSDLAGLFSDDESLLLPTTGKDQNTSNQNPASSTKPPLSGKSQENINSVAKETKESPVKKAVTFSKDGDIFDDLGLEQKPDDTSRPSRSALDDLFGKSSPPPLTFNTDKTETSQAGKLLMGKNGSVDIEKESDDFLFGSYLPSSAVQSAPNISSRGSRLEAESEKFNKRSEIVSTRQKSSLSQKSSFDDGNDDKLDWLKIASEQAKKSSGKSETANVADTDDDEDWLGMKSSKKSISFNLGDELDIDLSPAPLNHVQISGGARNEKETIPSTSALVTEKAKIQYPTSGIKETLKPKPTKPGVKITKDVGPKKETQKESQLEKKPEPVKLLKTHKKEMPPTADEGEELLQQLESVNLMPSLEILPTYKLETQHGVPSTSSPTKSPNLVNLRPHSADTYMSSSSFEKLTDAEIKISRLQIEKEQLEILIESVKKRCSEEIEAIEQSYKSRLQLLEETHQHKETRWKEENEQLLKQHLQKMQQLEQEKSELTARHYNILQSAVDENAAEVQRLKESHQTAMVLQCKEFEEALYRMKEVKQREVDSVENFQSTSKSLHLVIEQIQANAKDLNIFQQKLDHWQIGGMDEREMSIRARDQQLKTFQERLNRQQEENARERSRLEELICRLEGQLHSQTQLLDDEQWKVKQEVNKFHALQASVETEKKQWGEKQAREKAAMEKSRNALVEEQRQLMTQLFEERRALAEEKVHMEVSRKLWAEREQQNSIKAVKIETEFNATMKALEEERNKLSAQLELVETEKKALREDHKKFEKERKNFEEEKIQLTDLASQIKRRSKEVESLFGEAQKVKEEGEMALAKSNKMDLEYSQRWRDLMTQMDNLTEQEKQAAAERITMAQERDHLETLRKSQMCFNCRNSLSGGIGSVNGRVPKMTATFTSVNNGSAFWGGYQPETIPVQATEDSSPIIQDTLHAIRTDQWLRQLKKQSLKDKEFLLGEKVYLATLENSHYQPV